MKKPFEDYLTFIENQLGVELLYWHKMVLKAVYDGCHPYVYGVRNGKMIMEKEAKLLKEEMDRDIGNLPPHLYKLDGYTTDIVIYDELEKENDQ
jgi:hypothetical protein